MKKTTYLFITLLLSASTVSAMIRTRGGGGPFHELKQYQKICKEIKEIGSSLLEACQDWSDNLASGMDKPIQTAETGILEKIILTIHDMKQQQSMPETWEKEDPVGEIAKKDFHRLPKAFCGLDIAKLFPCNNTTRENSTNEKNNK